MPKNLKKSRDPVGHCLTRVAASALGAAALLGMPLLAHAADLIWAADTPIVVSGLTLNVQGGSRATTLVINNDGSLTVTVPASSSFTLHSATRRQINANPSIDGTCQPTENDLVISGPANVTLTAEDKACSKNASLSSGSSGGSSSAVATPAATTAPIVTTPTPKTTDTKADTAAKSSGASQKTFTITPGSEDIGGSAEAKLAEEAGPSLKEVSADVAKKLPVVSRTFKAGASGNDVKALQEALAAQGLTVGATGKFDATTKTAYEGFKKDLGVTSDVHAREVVNDLLGKTSKAAQKVVETSGAVVASTGAKAAATAASAEKKVEELSTKADTLDELTLAAKGAKTVKEKTARNQAVTKALTDVTKSLGSAVLLVGTLKSSATVVGTKASALSVYRIQDGESRAEAKAAVQEVKAALKVIADAARAISKKNIQIKKDIAAVKKNPKDTAAAVRVGKATAEVSTQTKKAADAADTLKENSEKLKSLMQKAFK